MDDGVVEVGRVARQGSLAATLDDPLAVRSDALAVGVEESDEVGDVCVAADDRIDVHAGAHPGTDDGVPLAIRARGHEVITS